MTLVEAYRALRRHVAPETDSERVELFRAALSLQSQMLTRRFR